MPTPRRITIIAKERPFDAEKWQQLLTAFAYVLHDRRTAASQPPKPAPASEAKAARSTP